MKPWLLVSDHDPRFGEMARQVLVSRGYRVSVATTGLECLEQLATSQPTVLVLDAEMLWGGCAGVLECLLEEQAFVQTLVVLVETRRVNLPTHLQRWVDLRIQRPRSRTEFSNYVTQLEALAVCSVQSSRCSGPLSDPAIETLDGCDFQAEGTYELLAGDSYHAL